MICHVDEKSIGGFFSFNEVQVWCLLDTGTERTVVGESLVSYIKKSESNNLMTRVSFGLESCIGEEMTILGTLKLRFKAPGFEGEVEVVVVRGLTKDCLLGLDIAKKMPAINEV
jgi:hypothetical protein